MVTFLKAQAWLNSPEQKAPPQAQVLVVVAAHDKVLNTLARLSKILESSSPHQAQDLAVVAVRDILFTALGTGGLDGSSNYSTEGLARVLIIVSFIT